MVFVPSNRCWLADGFRRGVRRGKDSGLLTRRFAPRGGERSKTPRVRLFSFQHDVQCGTNPRLHRADTCARASRQVSARFRRIAGRTRHFAPAPFAAASASDGGLLPLISTAANCRDRQRQRCARRNPDGRETSSGQQKNIGARRCLSPKKTTAIAPRGCARCSKTSELTVRPASFGRSANLPLRKLRSRALHFQNRPDSLHQPNWSDTPLLGCAICSARMPCSHIRPAEALRSNQRRVRGIGFALARLRRQLKCPGEMVEAAPL